MKRAACLGVGAVAGVALLLAGCWVYSEWDEWQQTKQLRDAR